MAQMKISRGVRLENPLGLKATVLLAAVLFSLAAFAQQMPKRAVIHAGKLLDVKTGSTLSDQAIVIDGDKIVSVGPMSSAKLTGNEQRIELGDARSEERRVGKECRSG